MAKSILSWNRVADLAEKLGKKVKFFRPDVIVGISRGGLIPARLLADYLDVHKLAVIKIEFLERPKKLTDFPIISQPLHMDVKQKKVLIVDDITDSGRTLAIAKEHIGLAGAKEIRTATLFFKKGSVVRPEYFCETTDEWIIFPWEKFEFEREKGRKKSIKGR